MTRLDRLEALVKQARENLERPWSDEDADFLMVSLKTIPDLIRVARAARNLADDLSIEAEGFWWEENYQELETTLAPLFSEVES